MKVHVLQHVPFEDIGGMADWLARQGAEIGYTRFYENAELPDPTGLDLVIAMGGPMSVNDEAELPWLVAEKAFVRSVVSRSVPMLGVCLGAQLIASALGARVYRNPVKEIGWFPVRAANVAADVFQFPAEARVFHWHGETFDLPEGAVRLARSAVCENQAFQLGRNVVGLQFHLETTQESAEDMLEHGRAELVDAPYIQDAATVQAEPAATYIANNALMARLLAYLTGRA
ncbi:MAG: type 1 glutamine amidotransferase [Sideroxyarcus sp.]|nr:type 1 glutamine amidotransferase [Sideroxyarcus sp.]